MEEFHRRGFLAEEWKNQGKAGDYKVEGDEIVEDFWENKYE